METHAAERNHATAANGFMHLGARTVLGSVFPLNAPQAASFTARLLYRVAAYLAPGIAMLDRPMRWSEVIWGMLRMQLLTDFLRQLEGKRLTDQSKYEEIHLGRRRIIDLWPISPSLAPAGSAAPTRDAMLRWQ